VGARLTSALSGSGLLVSWGFVPLLEIVEAGGPNMTVEHICRVIEGTNELRPDLVVLLGDYIATHRFVTEHVPHERWAGELGRLAAPLGVWAVLGNHDWLHGVCAVRSAFAAVGIPCLENRAVQAVSGWQASETSSLTALTVRPFAV
jgi:hypothetical protein